MNIDILRLFDPGEREHAEEIFREWLEFPEHHHPDCCVLTLQNELAQPLEGWFVENFKKNKGQSNTATEAAVLLSISVNDLIYSYKSNEMIDKKRVYINQIIKHWKDFQKHIAWDNAYSKYQFNEKQRKIAQKPRTSRGLPPSDRKKRDDAIIAHYKKAKLSNPKLSINGFAEKHHAKYGLGVKQVRKILTAALGT